ncbi:ZrgA family zinc uptake protein [Thiocystis violascens]|uniref:DUF2796 domain-containing protein n=1 Tax=Thiocystis violascens (strain ATCC 17096 / DSM 198 / 6111) TaxID=765911 RepID=I3YDS1_THIV6|nr:DUF2796 domain-containing protein [Thiocystis violascens]AFL75139.1 Protein of unknown function (DUF2796) [Thiocystis violascens DSM 198]
MTLSPRFAPRRRLAILMVLIVAIEFAGTTSARESPPRQPTAHVQGTARIAMNADGPDVLVELSAPAVTLVGFEHAPATADERETLRLARENLKAGDGMIRFNTNADCRLIESRVDAQLSDRRRTSTRGQDPGTAEPAHLTARYRFRCDRPDRLDSAALGLFMGFPVLQRVLVHYVTNDGQGEAELTPVNPIMSFVPLSGVRIDEDRGGGLSAGPDAPIR